MNPLKKLLLRDGDADRDSRGVHGGGAADARPWADDMEPPAQPAPIDLEDIWQESSFDLRSGADITDFSETIPTDEFDRLFKG
jgi:hypothetical protein